VPTATAPNGHRATMPRLSITAEDALRQARSQLGNPERPVNITPYGAWYQGGEFQGQPYCAIGLSWCWAMAGDPLAIQTPDGFSYCPAGLAWFRDRGALLPPSATPLPGDVAFFDFHPRDGLRLAEHVAFVEYPDPDSTVATIEFNTGDAVRRRRRTRDEILGFGRPDYADDPHAARPRRRDPLWSLDGHRHPLLKVGAHGPEVGHVQRLLLAAGRNLAVDDAYGPITKAAVAYTQQRNGLAVDGECGHETWPVLHHLAWGAIFRA
jgi:hypothetical protein